MMRPSAALRVPLLFFALMTGGLSLSNLKLDAAQAVPTRSSARTARISLDSFIVSLRKLEAAAQDRVPFDSIKAVGISGGSRSASLNITLPTADLCKVEKASKNGLVTSIPFYECNWKFSTAAKAKKSYEDMEEKILESGDWVAKRDESDQSVRHAAYDASTGALVCLRVTLGTTNTIRIVIAAGKIEQHLGAASSPKQSAAQRQDPTAMKDASGRQQMSMGMLAVLSDRGGNLTIDGEPKVAIAPGKVTTLKLTAGQHFVALLDENGSQSKLWEKIVEVPAGVQVVEKIDLGIGVRPETRPGNAEQQRNQNPGMSGLQIVPTADDYPKSVATAIVQMMDAGNSNFEQVKGPPLISVGEMKKWQVSVVVPGFECSLNEFRDIWHIYCAADQKADGGETNHLAIARALSEQLRPINYSCVSGAVEPSTPVINPVSVQRFVFRRSYADPTITQYLNRYSDAALHIKPSGTFNVSFILNPPLNPSANKAINDRPLECDFSYAALKSQELNIQGGTSGTTATAIGGKNEEAFERSSLLESLNGDWSCDAPTLCVGARVAVSGPSSVPDKFSAVIDLGPSDDPTVIYKSNDLHGRWNISGIIDGLRVDGIATEPSGRLNQTHCDVTGADQKFDATISADGQRIVIHTFSNTYTSRATYHLFLKRTAQCDFVKVNHTEPMMFVLRSLEHPLKPVPLHTFIQQPPGTISNEIDGIVASGRYRALPQAQSTSIGISAQSSISIDNRTAYELTVLLAGPIERSLAVSAGGSQTVELPPGNYRVVGKVNAPNVLPFFGSQTYATGTSYSESFYIK